jgi:hypothetical protein
MATDQEQIDYFRTRWEYSRPNLITLSNNPGKYHYSTNYKVWLPEGVEGIDYIFLSDHNRSSADFGVQRIGDQRRMINGDMRSYFIADKMTLPLSWDNIPSRSYSNHGGFAWWVTNKNRCAKFTVDGGAGGAEMLDWWQKHRGSMWAFINIDNNVDPSIQEIEFINGYSRVYEVICSDFSYDVVGRSGGYKVGSDIYSLDLWDVSMTLEEV